MKWFLISSLLREYMTFTKKNSSTRKNEMHYKTTAYQAPVEFALTVFEGTPWAVITVMQFPISYSTEEIK